MSVIVFLACLITAVSVWFLTRPPRVDTTTEGRLRELGALRERLLAQLREIDADRADRKVDDAIAVDEVRRIEFELAQVLKEQGQLAPQGTAEAAPRRRRSPVAVAVLTVFLAGLSGSLYFIQSREWLRSMVAPAVVQANGGQGQFPPVVFQMVERLREHLERHPKDLAGWMRLAHSYAVLGRRHAAEVAYRHAYGLAPRDPRVLSSYAWLLYSAHPTRTTGPVADLYHRLYRIDPKRQDALWFLGLEAYNDGHLHHAIGFWQRLLRLMPKSSPAAKGVEEAIANVHAALKRRPAPVRTPG
ncbi:MAG: TPR domain-containing protein [Acidiferrobacteraceae bacterium]